MRTSGVINAALASIVLGACDTDLITERGQVSPSAPELHRYFFSGDDIAEGSVLCLDERFGRGPRVDDFGEDDVDLRACYDERIVGAASIDVDGCYVLDTPGGVSLEFERRACEIEGDFGDDRVHFEVLPLSDVRGAFDVAVRLDVLLEQYGMVGELPSSTPGWLAEVGEPMFVIEDLLDDVATDAVRRDRPTPVATTRGRSNGTVIAGTPTFPPSDASSSSRLRVDAKAGDVFQVELSLAAGTLDVGEVHVVARESAVELVLAPSILRVADTDQFLGIGAEAVARDLDGRVLREPPVSWSVVRGDFDLDYWDDDDDGIRDRSWSAYLVDDDCDAVAAGTWRSATLAAEMDALRETVDLRWECVDGDDGGCACALDDRRSIPVWILVLVLARRRGAILTAP